MPANLPPEARKKWAEVEATRNPKERLRLMQEFVSLVPKHKGTAKTLAQVKKQMAMLRKDMEERKKKASHEKWTEAFLGKGRRSPDSAHRIDESWQKQSAGSRDKRES